MRVHADREVCVAAGMCALTAPDLFDQDEDEGRVIVLRSDLTDHDVEAAHEAVELCPSGALRITG